MSIPLWPDWNRLYDAWKCLDRWVPFTDEQQEKLFQLKWQPNEETKRRELIRRWRAEFEVSKLEDPKQLQAHANAEALKSKLNEVVNGKVLQPKEEKKPEENKPKAKDYNSMSFNELKALAKEKGLVLKNPKKEDVIKALEELGE